MTPFVGICIIAAAVVIGSLVQSVIGFGVGLLAAPIMALLEPSIVPVSLLVLGIALPIRILSRYWADVDFAGVKWALVGRVPGMLVGGYVIVAADDRLVGIAVASAILIAITLTLMPLEISKNVMSLGVAGFISGVTGTAAGIGGPPLGLIYARDSGRRVRATLSVFLIVGCSLSLLYLIVLNEVTARALLLSVLLIPFSFIGYVLAKPLQVWVDRGWVRWAVIGASAASAFGLLLRTIDGGTGS